MSEAAATTKRRGGRKPGTRNAVSSATISREIRIAALASFSFLGKEEYLIKVGKKNPSAYLNFLAKCIKQDDGSGADEALRIVVQQINVLPGPVPGVLASPVAEHVAPLRLVANGGDVVDAE